MKRALLFLVFLLLLTNISALNEDLVNKVERISTNIEISSKLTLESTSQNYAISFSQADLSFLPLERENQQVISIEYEPEPLKKGSSNTVFRWDNPSLGEYNYRISAELLNSINRKKVRTMIGFPIKHLPAEYEIYTKATENIDSNDPEIVRIASELAEGNLRQERIIIFFFFFFFLLKAKHY